MVNNTGILHPFDRKMLQLLQGIVNTVFTVLNMLEASEGGLSDCSKKRPVAAERIESYKPASGPVGVVPAVPLSPSEV